MELDTEDQTASRKELAKKISANLTEKGYATNADINNVFDAETGNDIADMLGKESARTRSDLTSLIAEQAQEDPNMDKSFLSYTKDFFGNVASGAATAVVSAPTSAAYYTINDMSNIGKLYTDSVGRGVTWVLNKVNGTNVPYQAPESFKQLVADATGTDGSFAQIALKTYEDLSGEEAPESAVYGAYTGDILGQMAGAVVPVCGANKAMLGLMRVKGGILGTTSAAEAFKDASWLAEKAGHFSPKIAKAFNIPFAGAVGRGVLVAGAEETAILASMYENSFDNAWRDYAEGYKEYPVFSTAMLLGGTALEAYSLYANSSRVVGGLLEKASATAGFTDKNLRGSTAGAISTLDIYSSPDAPIKEHMQKTLNADYNMHRLKKVRDFINNAPISTLSADSKKMALSELDEQIGILEKVSSENIKSISNNEKVSGTIKNIIEKQDPALLATVDSVKVLDTPSNKIAGTLFANKKATITYKNLEKSITEADKNGQSVYIGFSNGKIIPAESYLPDTNMLETARLKKGTNNLWTYELGSAKESKYSLSVYDTPSLETMNLKGLGKQGYANVSTAYAFIVKANLPELSKINKKGELVYSKFWDSLVKQSDTNPVAANTLAMVCRQPEASNVVSALDLSRPQLQNKANELTLNFVNDLFVAAGDNIVSPNAYSKILKFAGYDLINPDQFTSTVVARGKLDAADSGVSLSEAFRGEDNSPVVLYFNREELKKAEQLGQFVAVRQAQAIARKTQLAEIFSNNPMLKDTIESIGPEQLELARNIDLIASDSLLPTAVAAVFQKGFGYNQNAPLKAAHNISLQLSTSIAQRSADKLSNLKVLAKAAKANGNFIDIDYFKRLVQFGAEIGDDFQLKTIDTELGKRLTDSNLNFIETAYDQKRISDNTYDAFMEANDAGNPITYLPKLDGEGGQFKLSNEQQKYLLAYNEIQKQYYEDSQAIRAALNEPVTNNYQPFHMPPNGGRYANFIVDATNGDEIYRTITANNEKELKELTDSTFEILSKRVEPNRLRVLTMQDMKMAHKNGFATRGEPYFWDDISGDSAKDLRYKSGRTTRTTVSDMPVYEDFYTKTYEAVLRRQSSYTKLAISSLFEDERATVKSILDNRNLSDADKRAYIEYLSTISGVNTQPQILTDLNKWFDKLIDSMEEVPAIMNARTYLTKMQTYFESISKNAADNVERLLLKQPRFTEAVGKNLKYVNAALNYMLLTGLNITQALQNAVSGICLLPLGGQIVKQGAFETTMQAIARNGISATPEKFNEYLSTFTPDYGASLMKSIGMLGTNKGKAILKEGINIGTLEQPSSAAARYVNLFDLQAFKESGTWGKLAAYTDKALRAPYELSEDGIKYITYLTGYNMAATNGADNKMAHTFARVFSDRITGNYNVLNKASVFQGNLLGGLGLFKTFALTMAQNLLEVYGTQGIKGLVRSMPMQLAMTGTNSLPLNSAIESMLFPDENIDTSYTSLIKQGVPEPVVRSMHYGIAGLCGLDFSRKNEIDPVKGDFMPFSNGLNWNSIHPIIPMFNNTKKMVAELANDFSSERGMSQQRFLELVNTYSPMWLTRSLSGLGLYTTDANGGRTYYTIDKKGYQHNTSAIATMLQLRQIHNVEMARILNKQSARDTENNRILTHLKSQIASDTRKNPNALIEHLPDYFVDYVKNGGDPNKFTRFITSTLSTRTYNRETARLIKNLRSTDWTHSKAALSALLAGGAYTYENPDD